jgi:hypothetical protein
LNFGGTGRGSLPYVIANMVTATVTELVLVMNLETQASGSTTLSWVPACATAPIKSPAP